VHGALESVAVLWRLRSYRDIIIIIIIMPTRDKFPGFGRTFKEIPGPESGIAPGTRAPLLLMVIFSLLVNRGSSSNYICSRYNCMPAFHFHSFLLSFVNLWPISTLCVADMVHGVADVVCGLYGLWPISSFPTETGSGPYPLLQAV